MCSPPPQLKLGHGFIVTTVGCSILNVPSNEHYRHHGHTYRGQIIQEVFRNDRDLNDIAVAKAIDQTKLIVR